MEKYCRNCGKYGHLYNQCYNPIMSYGIILFNDNNEIIMIERKDTLSYIEFLRGRYYNLNNISYIKLLIDRFSVEEKERILKYTFDELWSKLWINLDNINSRIKSEYKKSSILFNKLSNGFYYNNEFINLKKLINNSKTIYINNEWEIPKGRREKYETNKDCAIREFNEETNLKEGDYMIIDNIFPITENYIGSNNINYCHTYYIAKLLNNECNLYIDIDNKNQFNEIKNIKWMSKEQCINNIRNYDYHKIDIIKKFYKWKDEYKNFGKII